MYTAMMAHSYSGDPHSVIGWSASRKLNGNRAIWNGKILQTLGRYSGAKIIYPPAWWSKQALPQGVPCDGELWHISDDKDLVRSIAGQGIAKSVADPRWADIRYMVFDYKPYEVYQSVSSHSPESLPEWCNHKYYLNYNWKMRQEILYTGISDFRNVADNPLDYLRVCRQTVMQNAEHVKEYIEHSRHANWEGIVFANPVGIYTLNRSHNLLKSKPLFDHECQVIGIEIGEGKHAGRVGALICFLTWNEQVTSFKGGRDDMIGKRVSFRVGGGLTDDQREDFLDPEKRPRTIRFSFLEVSKFGIPQSPNYLESM